MIQLFIQDANININDFIDNYLQNISDDLKNNPKFKEQLYSAINYLTRKNELSERIPPLELSVGEDGRSFEIRSGVRQSPETRNEYLRDNKNYDQVKISLDNNNNMEVTRSNGVFYKFDDYMKVDMEQDIKNKLSMLNSSRTPTILSAYHTHRTFLPSGIEVEESTYFDQYPLSCSFSDERELKVETMAHAPSQWYYNLVPGKAKFEFMPSVTNAYRSANDLGIVNVQSQNGRNNNVNFGFYPANTEYPEELSYSPTLIGKYESGKIVIDDNYQKYFPGMNQREIQKEINKSFLKGIDTSRTQETKPEICDALREMVRNGLVTMYGVNEEELETGKTR